MSEREGGASGSGGATGGGSASGSGSASGRGEAKPVLVDVNALTNVFAQARGPILDRLLRQLPKLTGNGSVDVLEWMCDFERLCTLEKVNPVDIIGHMLDGNAARFHRRMMFGDANQWEVVKAALTVKYAMPRQEAWRKFTELQLESGESLDSYLDCLERLAGRCGINPTDMAFRLKFYEGLPTSVYEAAVARDDAYSGDFDTIVSKVQDSLSAQKVAAGRSRRNSSRSASLTASGQQAGSSKITCYRCGGPHRVKDCRQKQGSTPVTKRKPMKASTTDKSGSNCFACGEQGHFARDCPVKAASGTSANFQKEGTSRGDVSSEMEM